jgi:WD40 repeat protein
MATEAQVRVAFSTDHAELQVTSAPFSVPVNVNASGLSEVISHLLNLSPPQTFSFLVIDDAQLLHSSIENYLIEHHKSREAVLRLKFFPSTKGPEKTSSSPCPDWVSDISTSLQNLVFAACYDGTAQIKDALGNKLLTVCTGHKSAVKAISVCPTSRGGFRMVTASKDHTIGLWESDKFESAGNMKRNAQNSDKRGNDQDDQANERANLPATIPIVRTATGRHLKSVDAIAMASMNTFFFWIMGWNCEVMVMAWHTRS